MLRIRRLIPIALIVLGLVPVGAWLALASSLEPGGLGRNIGLAVLIILAPLPVGGLLMIAGAAFLGRRPRAGRIVATAGAGIVAAGTGFLGVVWAHRFADCGGPPGICTPELLEAMAGFGYALLHACLIVMVWRSRETRTPVAARCA